VRVNWSNKEPDPDITAIGIPNRDDRLIRGQKRKTSKKSRLPASPKNTG